jgi:uncharacterized protein YbjT (DUF2867 family)
MTRSILVTGATGKVGTEVVRQLVQSGQDVRVLVRDASRAPDGVDIAVGDLTQPRTLTPAFDGVQKVFVLAPFPFPDAEKMEMNAFEAGEQAGVEHIVYLSAFGAGRFDHELFRGHGASEWRLRGEVQLDDPAAGALHVPRAVCLEVGPRQGPTARTARRKQGRHDRSPRHRRGRVAGSDHRRTRGKDLRTVRPALTGPEIAADLAAALGRPVEFVDAGDEEYRQDLIASGLPEEIAEGTLAYFAILRAGHFYETTTAADLLDRPLRSYRDWLRDHLPDISR